MMPVNPVSDILSNNIRPRGEERLGFFDRTILFALFLFLLVDALQGPARYYLLQLGAPYLIYAPKVAMAFGFLILMLRAVLRSRISLAHIILFIFTLGICLSGLNSTNNYLQVGFGLFVLLPFLFSAAAAPTVAQHQRLILLPASLLWLVASAGVGINFFTDFPWTGLTYQIEQMEVAASREWSSYGVARLAGFSRASYEAAGQILVYGLTCTLIVRFKLVRAVIWLATGLLIAFTTTKIAIIAYFILTLILPFMILSSVPRSIARSIRVVMSIGVIFVGLALPLSSLLLKFDLGLTHHQYGFLLASFEDRLVNTWPAAFDLVYNHGNIFIGRGVGGVGAAQQPFEPDIYSPADNMYVYMYVTAGLLSFFVFLRMFSETLKAALGGGRFRLLAWFLFVTALMLGWMSGGLESAIISVLLGFLVSAKFDPRQRTEAAFSSQEGQSNGV